MSKYSKLFKDVTKGEDTVPSQEDVAYDLNPEKEERFSILFVDDEENVLNALRRIFLEENYGIFTAASAADALQIMEKEKMSSWLLMPGIRTTMAILTISNGTHPISQIKPLKLL